MATKPTASIFIDTVHLRRNDVLTIYANLGGHEEPNLIQIEVRVTPDGQLEVFTDDQFHVRPFAEWARMEEA